MTAFAELERGDLVWANDPLSAKGRPMLVLGTPQFPTHEVIPRSVLSCGEVAICMARATSGESEAPDRAIRLLKNPDGQWTARDLRVEVTAQGESRDAALENLDAVVAAVDGDGGSPPTDKEIRDLGLDPAIARTQDDDLPDVLQ